MSAPPLPPHAPQPPPHAHHVDPGELVALEVHRHDVLARIAPLDPLELGLLEAHGCTLAEDLVAPADVPAFPSSSMDGFALRTAGLAVGAELAVVGEIAAGAADLPSPRPGQAIRIMTGGPLPAGIDAVVPVELVDEGVGTIRLRTLPVPGDNLRGAGEDVRAGELVLRAGTRLGAPQLGMCAALGRARVRVHPRARVVVLATGDEIVDPGEPLGPGQVHDANSYTLVAQAREAGATAIRHPIAPDDRRALVAALEGALASADLVLTSGGVSAGRYDLSKAVLAEMGDVGFRKVGVQPGMPQAFGTIGGIPVFGLPGNPVSAFVSFEVLVRPAIRKLQGRRDLNRPRVRATWDEEVRSPAHRVSFLRVQLRRAGDRWLCRTTGPQGSGILRSAVLADGLAEVPADRTSMAAGEEVLVHLLVDGS